MDSSSAAVTKPRSAYNTQARSLELVASSPQVRDADASRDLQTLKLAIASSPSGIAFCNQSGRIVLANPQLTAIFGYAANELLNCDFAPLVPDVVVPAGREAAGSETVCEVNGVRKD